MNVSLFIKELVTTTCSMADLVDRIAPRRPVLEDKLLRLIRTTQYTWKWHPGTGRVTTDLTAGYRVTLTPSEDATVVTLARKQPNDMGGLTDAPFPDMYLSLDVWYWAYNKATEDDSVTLDDILSGRSEPEDVLESICPSKTTASPAGYRVQFPSKTTSSIPLAARAIDEEMDIDWAQVRAQRDRNQARILNHFLEGKQPSKEINAVIAAVVEAEAALARNASEASNSGKEN